MTYDTWEAGDAYDAYVGRWSRRVAAVFLTRLARPAGGRWLDLGCGTGALSAAVPQPSLLAGVDRSLGFVRAARAAVPHAVFTVADARALPYPTATFDTVISGLALNFVPGPAAGPVGECARVTAPGGVVAAYVWDYAGGMDMMRRFWQAAIAVDPAAAALDEGPRFPLCDPDALRAAWSAAGLRDVAVAPIEIETTFADFADYWTPFLGGQGAAPGYLMSLPEAHRAAIRDRVRAALPDGPFTLPARAWSVAGTA
ncbi:class I SAM-dependent methyltransferase [Dactylosporangium sucinum]|uniref:Methyltransferase n=1 Tax=Dactylosporangium sucinum TaxID=1424081 RepID=A0A917X600_9ACTN|nr:class I SAM-dependent methyltransferase [Dactylosporangium sucinum]GGM70276.1 methyltransferase [Dactylosporangium sucinum]